jgi:hypothetical protein
MVLVYELYGLMEILKKTKNRSKGSLCRKRRIIGGSCFRKGGKP